MSRSMKVRSYILAGLLSLTVGVAAVAGEAGTTGAASGKAGSATSEKPASTAPGKAGGAGADKTGNTASPQLAKGVAKIQAAYSKLESLEAAFSQTSKLTAGSKARTDSGTVALKKGGKMRWDFEKPEIRQFISDGSTLWIYSPGDKQVMETSLALGASQTALNFMTGLGDLSKDFTPVLATEQEYQRPGMISLHLTPKEAIGSVKRLTIAASEQDGIVREAWIKDQMGTTTNIAFTQVKVNAPMADARFSFKAPQGVEVVRPQGF